MRLLSVALLLAAVGLTACNDDVLTTKTPVLFAADRDALPPARDGVWAGEGCSVDPASDLPAWDCDQAFIVRRGEAAHPDWAVENDPGFMKAMRVGVSDDFQVAQIGPTDPGADGFYGYHGVDGVRLDEAGQMIALRTWRLKCGPPPPDGSKTEGGKPRRQTLEPYPGVVVEEGGCAAKGRAGLLAAASASRVDPRGNHDDAVGWRWVRQERPGDWVEAQPVTEPPPKS
ncbi:MAG: hypothetical protein JWR84_1351 [Caulobacter sp.]|nr:hypothetical protein [Caulobacter sp.]